MCASESKQAKDCALSVKKYRTARNVCSSRNSGYTLFARTAYMSRWSSLMATGSSAPGATGSHGAYATSGRAHNASWDGAGPNDRAGSCTCRCSIPIRLQSIRLRDKVLPAADKLVPPAARLRNSFRHRKHPRTIKAAAKLLSSIWIIVSLHLICVR